MKRHYLLIPGLMLAAAAVQAGPKTEGSGDAAAFARLKTLVGEWEANTQMGKAHLSYELIAAVRRWWRKRLARKCRPC